MDPLVYRYGEFLTCLAVFLFFACTLYDDHHTRKVLRTMALNLDALTEAVTTLETDVQHAVAKLTAASIPSPDQQPAVDALAARINAAGVAVVAAVSSLPGA